MRGSQNAKRKTLMAPKVSIIVPVYNVEKYLPRCLDSLVNQTLKDIEIICVNDGSTDGSLAILQQYAAKDKRIKIIDKENEGAEAARNNALDIASGKYISFVDSDDWAEDTYLQELLSMLEKNNADMAECSYETVISDTSKRKHNLSQNLSEKLLEITPENFCFRNKILWNKLFKNALVQAYNLRFPLTRYFGDNYFVICYTLLCKTVFLSSKKLYIYRIHNTSLISKFLVSKPDESYKIVRQYLTVWLAIVEFVKKNDFTENYKQNLLIFFTNEISRLIKTIPISYQKIFLHDCYECLKNFYPCKEKIESSGLGVIKKYFYSFNQYVFNLFYIGNILFFQKIRTNALQKTQFCRMILYKVKYKQSSTKHYIFNILIHKEKHK